MNKTYCIDNNYSVLHLFIYLFTILLLVILMYNKFNNSKVQQNLYKSI